MMGGYQGTVCHHCGKPIDQLELCDCPRAMASHIRSRTSMTYVAEAFDSAAKTIDRLRAEVAKLEAEYTGLREENTDLKLVIGESYSAKKNLEAEVATLKEENAKAVEGHRAATEVSAEYAKQNRNLTQQLAALQELSVSNILIDVVPGEDGMGQEVYAKSVSEIEALLTKLSEENENLKAYAKHERSLGAEPWMLRCNDLTQQLAAANGRIAHMQTVMTASANAISDGYKFRAEEWLRAALSDLPEADKEKTK